MILKNFKPYNKLDYFSCYYKGIFHILDYFNLNVFSILFGQLYAYAYTNDNKSSFCLFQYSLHKDIFKYTGLKVERILVDRDNFGRQVIECCKSNKPILLLIDSYYFPFSKDMYHESHTRHYICLYGYDENKKIFYAIDIDFLNSFAYKEQVIKYSSMQNYFRANQDPNLYFSAFSKNASAGQQNSEDYIKEYSRVLLEHKELLNDGITKLDGFIQFFLECISDNNPIKVAEFIQKLTMTFVNITRGVKQREDLLKAYITDAVLLNIMDSISAQWVMIRSLLLKYLRYEESRRSTLLASLPNYCLTVLALERKFNSMLLDYCEKQ